MAPELWKMLHVMWGCAVSGFGWGPVRGRCEGQQEVDGGRHRGLWGLMGVVKHG